MCDLEEHRGWLTDPATAFYVSIGDGLLPVTFPVLTGGEATIATLPIRLRGRVRQCVMHPDKRVRGRAIAGLLVVARERVRDQLGAEGVLPA